MEFKNKITAIITTSPIPSHPQTDAIEQVYDAIRYWLPDAPILILVDGVRAEQEHLRKRYEEYKNKLQEKISSEWKYVKLRIFEDFTHQAGMLRTALSENLITTPLILWNEHDFMLLTDKGFDWEGIIKTLLEENISWIRISHDEDLRYENRRYQIEQYFQLTGGEEMHAFRSKNGVPLFTSLNWGSPPFVAHLDFYKFLISFFKEGKIHLDCSETHEAVEKNYKKWKGAVYIPDGDIKRFTILRGRESEPKYPMTF